MKDKFFLYLTDENVRLYRGSLHKLCVLPGSFKEVRSKLEGFLSSAPKIPLSLIVDCQLPNIREEKLPTLFPWDYIRFLFYKRAEWATLGGYVGSHFIREEGTFYLRWVHVSANDPLTPWVLWMKTLSNTCCGIFFAPLEAEKFLSQHFPKSNGYQVLVYEVSPQKIRHVIFKGRRLLLSRLSQGNEDIKSSLHFLSRSHPTLYENLKILTLTKETLLSFVPTKTLPDPQAFLWFLGALKRPLLPLRMSISLNKAWIRPIAFIAGASFLMAIGIMIYEGQEYQTKAFALSKEIEALKSKIQHLKPLLTGQNVPHLRQALEQYHLLKVQKLTPFAALEKLSILLKKHQLHLEMVKWSPLEIDIKFLMHGQDRKSLAPQLDSFLVSCRKVFLQGEVLLLQGPYKSSPQETFESLSEGALPMVRVKIVLP
jgi:hypothetical protein